MSLIPGIPFLPSSVSIFIDIPLLIGDAINFLTGFGGAQWGIFQDGIPVVEADSVVSIGYKQDWSISQYPVEEGGFESYNKVDTPFNSRVRFASGGSQANRQALLDSIASIAGNLELYDVVTPEQVYPSVNIQGYNLIRTAQNGVGLIMLDVQLLEVRVTAESEFSNTKSPSATGQINDGTVQPQPYRGPSLGPLQGKPIT